MCVFVRIFRCFVDAIRKEIILNIQKLFAYIIIIILTTRIQIIVTN